MPEFSAAATPTPHTDVRRSPTRAEQRRTEQHRTEVRGPSAIGLSTYSFFWQWHETAPRPLSLAEIVAKTASWGVDLLQLCDYPALDRYDAAQAADLAAIGRDLGVAYELGTRGLDTAHLLHYLELAGRLDVTLVRSMVKSEEIADAPELLAKVVPAYEDAGVTLALETYEQIPTPTLVDLVADGRTPHTSASASTPATRSPRSRHPRSTIDLTAPFVRNLHVKDFAFSRQAGWVGFTYAGCALGEGLLDYDYLVEQVRPHERGINQIIEHWLLWQGDSETTCRLEDDWTLHNLALPAAEGRAHPSRRSTADMTENLTIAVIGAGGKMGMRVSNNLAKSAHNVRYVENSPAGQQRTVDAGREVTDAVRRHQGRRRRHPRRAGHRAPAGHRRGRPAAAPPAPWS